MIDNFIYRVFGLKTSSYDFAFLLLGLILLSRGVRWPWVLSYCIYYLIAVIDVYYHYIPPELTFILSCIYLLLIGPLYVIGGLLFAILFVFMIVAISTITNTYIIGGGDAKLMLPFSVFLMSYGILKGLTVFIIFLLLNILFYRKQRIQPMGPVFFGTICTLLCC